MTEFRHGPVKAMRGRRIVAICGKCMRDWPCVNAPLPDRVRLMEAQAQVDHLQERIDAAATLAAVWEGERERMRGRSSHDDDCTVCNVFEHAAYELRRVLRAAS